MSSNLKLKLVGTYKWSQGKRGLRFVQVAGSSDPCPRAPILIKGAWTRG